MKMKRIFKGDPFVVLTHHDLDGAGCAILLKDAFGDQIKSVKSTGYGKINKQADRANCKNLFITDLSLNQEQIDHIDSITDNVILIDHHESTLQFDFPDHWKVMLNMNACGTKLTYLYLKSLGVVYEQEQKDFVDLVNDFDMWALEMEESKLLNNLFWDSTFWEFVKKFGNFVITEKDLQKGKELQDVKDAEIAEFHNYLIDDVLRVVVTDDHISDISEYYTNEEFFVIFRGKGLVSFRSTIDMSPFYDKMNALGVPAGGHKFAGGGELSGTEYEEDFLPIVETFYDFIKENK
jgi:oligoribonuclease NrnB/cAMP/cGMP phosphodiesterase (DHH superfamily)